MIAAEHALALFLLVVVPIADVFSTRALKNSKNSRRKILMYQATCIVSWAAAIVAWVTLGSNVFYVWPGIPQNTWLRIAGYCVWGAALLWMAASALRLYRRRNLKLRDATVAVLKRLDFFFPLTLEEQAWFAALAITAGICEEVLYRGFLIHYLADGPWHLGLVVAVVVPCVSFGLAHGYQGSSGILSTGLVGAGMALIFLVTGSLWLPMVLHAFIDLSILPVLRRREPAL